MKLKGKKVSGGWIAVAAVLAVLSIAGARPSGYEGLFDLASPGVGANVA